MSKLSNKLSCLHRTPAWWMRHCPCSAALPLQNVMPPSCALLSTKTHAYTCRESPTTWCHFRGPGSPNCPHLPPQVACTSCWLPTHHRTWKRALWCRSPSRRSCSWRRCCPAAAATRAVQVNRVQAGGGLCPTIGFVVISVEPLFSAVTDLVRQVIR